MTAEGWWARFAPQLWLVPIAGAVAASAVPARRGARVGAAVAFTALAASVRLAGTFAVEVCEE